MDDAAAEPVDLPFRSCASSMPSPHLHSSAFHRIKKRMRRRWPSISRCRGRRLSYEVGGGAPISSYVLSISKWILYVHNHSGRRLFIGPNSAFTLAWGMFNRAPSRHRVDVLATSSSTTWPNARRSSPPRPTSISPKPYPQQTTPSLPSHPFHLAETT